MNINKGNFLVCNFFEMKYFIDKNNGFIKIYVGLSFFFVFHFCYLIKTWENIIILCYVEMI